MKQWLKTGDRLKINLAGLGFITLAALYAGGQANMAKPPTVRINNGFVQTPLGIAFIVNNQAGFVLDVGDETQRFTGPGWGLGSQPGRAAPDDSFHHYVFHSGDASVQWEWGRVSDAIVGRLQGDHATAITFKMLDKTWPGFESAYQPASDGVTGEAALDGENKVIWRMSISPAPTENNGRLMLVPLEPGKPMRLVAGIGPLPAMDQVDGLLDHAEQVYLAGRPAATGPWGDFLGAIEDNLNNSRVYSTDNQMLAYTVARNWAAGPNRAPYFCWDSFFNGLLGSLFDPETAKNTVRALLSFQTADGLVPNYAHWSGTQGIASTDRSQPPVGSMCVWKMYQRQPNTAFLREVYPKLVKWHAWWLQARDGNHDGLLEWGSDGVGWQGARWESGWDDTPAFRGADMVGSNMNANAVGLNSLWSMDAEYLALIADELGKRTEAARFRSQHEQMNERINRVLWNQDLGLYCTRLWNGKYLIRLTPLNFYPLACGAPDAEHARQVLKVLTDPKKFWGQWMLPTLPYDDPLWKEQRYWHGTVWAPVNYLVFQGLKRYAPAAVQREFAQRSVELFMPNWTEAGSCGENFLSTNGQVGGNRHYTWGALMCLVGLESIVDLNSDGSIVTRNDWDQNFQLKNIPLGGKRYHVTTKNGHTSVEEETGN
jgi:hypothetical protein